MCASFSEYGRRTIYTDSMEIFHRAADLINLDHRTRLEMEEPDYEHIFYVSLKLRDRLVPLPDNEKEQFHDLPISIFRNAESLERLADGALILKDCALLGSNVTIRQGKIRLTDGTLYRFIPGMTKRFKAYRVQHNQARGPYRGGVRYHKDASLDLFKCLAAQMSWQSAIVNVPLGGAQGGIKIEPRAYAREELDELTQRYMYRLKNLVGPNFDILAPEVGTDAKTMAILLRQYCWGEREHHKMRGAVTGKELSIGGAELPSQQACALGLFWCIDEWMRERGESVRGKTFTLQGFGRLGSTLAILLAQNGCRPVAICDEGGAIFNPNGIDLDALTRHVFHNKNNLRRTVKGFSEAEAISPKDFVDVEADIFIPAALENQLTHEVAGRLKVRLVAEGACSPTTSEADEILRARKIDVVPDLIGSAGAVTLGYYEWLQNARMEHWSANEVARRLEKTMRGSYRIVRDIAKNRPTRSDSHDSRPYCLGQELDMRLAAMVLALNRIRSHYTLDDFAI